MMALRQYLVPLLFACTALAQGGIARADGARADDERPRYFYKGRDFGSEALFNPVYLLVNRGYDVLQSNIRDRAVFRLHYEGDFDNVAKSLSSPFGPIHRDGWGRFLSEEIFPLSIHGTGTRWVPNYSLHLIGGGMNYAMLREWFEDHDYPRPLPIVAAVATMLSAAMLNETLENNGVRGDNTDAIADFFFFDIGGMIFFSFKSMNRFFSEELHLRDWSLQPGLMLPRLELHNVGNYFAAKWALPFYPRLRLFSYFGMATTGGLSFLVDRHYSVSASAGAKITSFVQSTPDQTTTSITTAPTVAMFLDRDDNVLVALQWAKVDDYYLQANIYPGFVRIPLLNPGLWAVVDRRGGFVLGVSTCVLFGLGAGVGVSTN